MDRLGSRAPRWWATAWAARSRWRWPREHPERVDRLVLIDSAGFNLAAADRPWLLRVAGRRPVARLVEALPLRRPLVTLGLRQVFHDDAS